MIATAHANIDDRPAPAMGTPRRVYRAVVFSDDGLCTGETSMTYWSWEGLLDHVRRWFKLQEEGRIKPGYAIRVQSRWESAWEPKL